MLYASHRDWNTTSEQGIHVQTVGNETSVACGDVEIRCRIAFPEPDVADLGGQCDEPVIEHDYCVSCEFCDASYDGWETYQWHIIRSHS